MCVMCGIKPQIQSEIRRGKKERERKTITKKANGGNEQSRKVDLQVGKCQEQRFEKRGGEKALIKP